MSQVYVLGIIKCAVEIPWAGQFFFGLQVCGESPRMWQFNPQKRAQINSASVTSFLWVLLMSPYLSEIIPQSCNLTWNTCSLAWYHFPSTAGKWWNVEEIYNELGLAQMCIIWVSWLPLRDAGWNWTAQCVCKSFVTRWHCGQSKEYLCGKAPEPNVFSFIVTYCRLQGA